MCILPLLRGGLICSIEKFLVDHNGVPANRYDPKTSPFDLKADIEKLLEKKEREEARGE